MARPTLRPRGHGWPLMEWGARGSTETNLVLVRGDRGWPTCSAGDERSEPGLGGAGCAGVWCPLVDDPRNCRSDWDFPV